MIAPGLRAQAGAYINPALGQRRPWWEATLGWQGQVAQPDGVRGTVPATSEPAITHAGVVGRQFGLLHWYQRVHLSPVSLALGNVVSSQQRQVMIWNAWLDQGATVTAVTMTGGEGITLTGPGVLPLAFKPLQVRYWQVSVALDGPPTVAASITWTVSATPLTLAITGSRVTAFGWVPDWADGVRESLAWLTDVLQSPTGAEQRRQLRAWPRRSWSATVIVDQRERTFADLAFYGWSQRNWALPIWADVTWLSTPVAAGALSIALDTTHLDYRAGGLALLRGATAFDVEVVEIDAVRADGIDLVRPVQATWSAGARVYPVRLARLTESPQRSRMTDQDSRYDVSLVASEMCAWDAPLALPLYRGVPVLAERPDESDELSGQFEWMATTLDNDINLPQITDLIGTGLSIQQHAWLLDGRAERAAWRSLAYHLAGRCNLVWLPTHADDVRLVATAAASASTLDIEMIGYARFGGGTTGRRHLRIELYDGTAIHRRITGGTVVDEQTERLSLDEAVGVELRTDNVRRISWLQLMRGQDDGMEIKHVTDVDGVATADTLLRGVRDDLELAA